MNKVNTITIKIDEDNDIYEMTVNNEVYNTHKEKFESMNCFEKYKSYTNTNCVPKFCRELQTITE